MRILTLFMTLAATISASAATITFPSHPALSPDAKTLYFAYEGDIYRVPATGGEAVVVVTVDGNADNPVISPDGRWLAFSADIQGNLDVYAVPVEGGELRQLTYSSASDFPVSWSPDSKSIFFESNRSSAYRTSFRVSIDGGTPERMFDNYFNTVVNLVQNPKTGEYLFNESTESINFPTRKRYVGDNNSEIRCWNPSKRVYRDLTAYEGKDAWPMVDRSGKIYFVSDRWGMEANLAEYVEGKEPLQLTNFAESVQYPSISADGSAIAFVKEYKICIYNTADRSVSEPEISIRDNRLEVKRLFRDQTPSSGDPSPDGKKLACVIRGGLYVGDAQAKYLKKLETPADERVGDVLWAKDSKNLFYTRTVRGFYNIFTIAADGSSVEMPVYAGEESVGTMVLSHNGKILAFNAGGKVMAYFTETKETKELAKVELWAFQRYGINFSFDDNMLAFDAVNMFERDIFIYDFRNGSLLNLTNSASVESGAVFSPDGKYLYFIGNLTDSSFPRGMMERTLYKLPLQKYDSPFDSDTYDKLFAGKPAKRDSVTRLDASNVYRRLETVVPRGRQSSAATVLIKGRSWLLFGSDHEGMQKYYALELNAPDAKPREIKGLTGYAGFTQSQNDVFAMSRGAFYKIDLNSCNATKVEVKKDVTVDLRDEFRQMFYESWAALEENYYDPGHHNTDWRAVRDKYEKYLVEVKTRAQLRTLVNDMLGEINSSHLGFYSNGSENHTATSVTTQETGIVFSERKPYVVDRILPFTPADKVEIDLKPGDKLVAVNGVRVDEKANRYSYFTSPEKRSEISLTFARGGKENTFKVHTCDINEYKNRLYTEWEDKCRETVDAKTGGKVAYIHMRDMQGGALNSFMRDLYTYAYDKEGLILDLRYNNGGNVHKEVLDMLRSQAPFVWSHRDYPKVGHPNVAPGGKPIVCLVNEHSLSDAEVTSNGIQTLGIATIVGTETYRWIIFTSSVGLIDGSSCRMPAWGCYNLNGEDLEFTGVKPEIYVKNTFKDRLEGKDPQLDKAIEVILSK